MRSPERGWSGESRSETNESRGGDNPQALGGDREEDTSLRRSLSSQKVRQLVSYVIILVNL